MRNFSYSKYSVPDGVGMGAGCLAVILLIVAAFAISFFAMAGLVWLICWAAQALGYEAITFSWPLVLIVYIVTNILRSIFGGSSSSASKS